MATYEESPVYFLDLCTLAYQLHSQTLIWPMDPYYEQWCDSELRPQFMDKVHQLANSGQLRKFHGPGSLHGLKSNPALDPVISDYSLIYPWRPNVIRQRRE